MKQILLISFILLSFAGYSQSEVVIKLTAFKIDKNIVFFGLKEIPETIRTKPIGEITTQGDYEVQYKLTTEPIIYFRVIDTVEIKTSPDSIYMKTTDKYYIRKEEDEER